jgi:hypothetical protein
MDGRQGVARSGDAGREPGTRIDALIDRAVSAIDHGDRVTAMTLAGQVLAIEQANAERYATYFRISGDTP